MDDLTLYRPYLGTQQTVIIDRPLGSLHPTQGFLYPVNYGYIPNTVAGDGEEIDAYVLGVNRPLETFTGLCIAIIVRADDDEHKIVVSGCLLSEKEVKVQTDFVERFFDSKIELCPHRYAKH